LFEPYEDLKTQGMPFAAAAATALPDPIGVGAVGGSGTRLLAQVLSQSGVAMATPMNRAGDAFEWPPYRELLSREMLARYSRERILHNALHVFEQLLLSRRERIGLSGRCGWKVPGTFHWLEELAGFFPGFQYIHLVRSGLDMAYSGNQNQVKNWAGHLQVPLNYAADGRVTPHTMLEYWLTANERALTTAQRCLPGRMLVVRFEELCAKPAEVLGEVIAFLRLRATEQQLADVAALVKTPDSLGRYRQFDWRSDFTELQLARLEQLGYTP
jgi:hypothetical protein